MKCLFSSFAFAYYSETPCKLLGEVFAHKHPSNFKHFPEYYHKISLTPSWQSQQDPALPWRHIGCSAAVKIGIELPISVSFLWYLNMEEECLLCIYIPNIQGGICIGALATFQSDLIMPPPTFSPSPGSESHYCYHTPAPAQPRLTLLIMSSLGRL